MTKINFKTKFGINQSVEYLGDIKFLSFGVIKSQKNQRELQMNTVAEVGFNIIATELKMCHKGIY